MREEKTTEQLYREREKRVNDAIQLKAPDRVPLITSGAFFPARYAGITFQKAMYDYDELAAAWKKYATDFQPDMIHQPFTSSALGPLLEILDFKQLLWPSHGVAPDVSFQFVEGEPMKAEEYDAFLFDPSDFMLRSYLPRVCGALASLKDLPYIGGLYYTRALTGISAFGIPEVARALETLVKAGAEAQRMQAKAASFSEDLKALGFPIAVSGSVYAPFDYIGDYFRGTRGIMLDMYRRPEKLLKAMDKVLPLILDSAVESARKTGIPRVWIPLHKGADEYMSLEQFKTFYWPTLHQLMLALIGEGLTPCPFFEGQYISRLEIIGDIPKGKALYKFEHTDIFIVKRLLGDRVCLRGNVPASLLCTGSTTDVREYCRKLIDVVGKGGGLIVDGAAGIPDEARVENVKAMIEFTREYGVYR